MATRRLGTAVPSVYWHPVDGRKVQCDVCPRACRLREGQVGPCHVRSCRAGEVNLTTYGRAGNFSVMLPEQLRLFHFLPGAPVLTFGTVGAPTAGPLCGGASLRRPDVDALNQAASPKFVSSAAAVMGCTAVAFSESDPVPSHEYALDVAAAAREYGLHALAVTSGAVAAAPRREYYRYVDAVVVHLNAFREDTHLRLFDAPLAPVLETIAWLRHESNVWLELAYPLIPGENDSERELDEMTTWVAGQLGPEVPVHFGAVPRAAARETAAGLRRAREAAAASGLRYAYVEAGGQPLVTLCHRCGASLVARDGEGITEWGLGAEGSCRVCGIACAGVFEGHPARVATPPASAGHA